MILKVWPDGSVICEEDRNGPELHHGHSDDYFVINLMNDSVFIALVLVERHFGTGAQRDQVWAEVSEYYY